MKRRIGRILAWIGGIVVVLVGVLVVVAVFAARKEKVPERTLLTINFEQRVVEYVSDDPIAKILADEALSLRDVVAGLERAAADDRVVGLVARVGRGAMGFAKIQEIRDAVLAFRKSGKPAIAFAETFGEVGPGNGGYYLASAFGVRFLQPSGDVGLTGLAVEHPFVKGTLEKLGVEPRMDQRHEYKNAMNLFTETQFTDAHREATEGMVRSLYGQMVSDIAASLDKTPDDVRSIVDRGPILGPDAVSTGLVDSLVYYDEVMDYAKREVGGKGEFLSLKTYLARAGRPDEKGTTVALIYGVGQVVRGKSEYDPTSGTGTMGADTVAKAFRDAVKDKDVKAIVFRIDSPGGSYVASDAIWRETIKAKQAGKPVIVTMGDVAASGGYFVAMHADHIVAQPGTITGSIGVVAGKALTTEFWEKLGVTWDEVHAGENALFWSSGTDYTPAQWAAFQAWLDRVYGDFTGKVADGRKIADVHSVAKGRVWTGEEARLHGLVDVLGGFSMALRITREKIGLEEDAPIRLKVFPKDKTLMELVLEKGLIRTLGNGDVFVRLMGQLQPVFRFARTAGISHRLEVLEVPVWEVR